MEAIPTRMSGYAIGEQDFKSLRDRNLIYVDKTKFIRRIIETGSKCFFLARPRRFGKSLFLSTLRYFFEGRRELFRGLFIDSTDWNWEPYPVLRLDLNRERYKEAGKLKDVVESSFRFWETQFGIEPLDTNPPQRFEYIIAEAHRKTGRQVVILVDEYDKPLVGNLNNKELFEDYRAQLASLYSNFKSSAEHIRLVFLTGVSRFSKLSVFSDLNNIRDITFAEDYADICGITEKELLEYFKEGIDKMAQRQKLSYDGAVRLLKRNYDGYRFAAEGSDIYNPWSVLSAMEESRIGNYWNETGAPELIAQSLKKIHADLQELFDTRCEEDDLKGLDLLNPQPIALLYQTGYLTIKKYLPRLRKFQLGIPNLEVKKGLFNFLVPYYTDIRRNGPRKVVGDIVDGFLLGDPQLAMKALQAYFAGVSYRMKMENENNFHNAFYLLTDIIGLDTRTEVETSDGRIDITIDTDEFLYTIELKYDHSARQALEQIKERRYDRPWQTEDRDVFLIGAAFSSETRCIEDWEIEKVRSRKL